MKLSRRQWMQTASAGLVCSAEGIAQDSPLRAAGQDVELWISPVSGHTFRLSVLPLGHGPIVPTDGSLIQQSWGEPIAKLRAPQNVETAGNKIAVSTSPLAIQIGTLQKLTVDPDSGILSFHTGDAPLLGLGEGGPQFDRRGSQDAMRSGQGGYQLRTHGGRVPIPWLIGTAGWALYFHQPFGAFDFTGTEGKFVPKDPTSALPLDIFVVVSREPRVLMSEYAKLTGHPELPPLWSFGYQQSHRTLANHEEVIAEAKTFREKKLPCDTLI